MIRPLTENDFDAIHTAFVGAFSDYVVPMKPSPMQLRSMFERRGWVPQRSVASFEGEAVTGFVINCVDDVRAYNTGTGTLPSHRRSGLGRELMLRSFELLRDAGAREYSLEVISTNEKAVALYRALGFVESRRLDAWTLPVSDAPAAGRRATGTALPWDVVSTWWTSSPAWQNSVASILRATEPYAVIGDDAGYVVVFPDTGDVPQLAVRPDRRRRGIGRSLINEAAALAGKPLRFINMDANDRGLAAFLEAVGASRFLTQLEMRTTLIADDRHRHAR